jgi:hypothetical protein
MALWDLVASHIIDPAVPVQGGVGEDSTVVLVAKRHVASYAQAGINPVTAITLAANASAFSFDGVKQSTKPKWEAVPDDSGKMAFRHILDFFYYDYSQTARTNQLRMANDRYIAFVFNAKKDANGIELFGLDVGIECKEMSRAQQENGGAVRVLLQSPDKEYEAKPPQILDGGTGVYATNKALVDALLFLPTIGASGLSIVTYAAATPTAITITGTNFWAGGVNSAVTRVDLINQATGTVIPFTASVVASSATNITTTAPATGEGAGKVYKVRVTTTKGVAYSSQNITTT